MKKVTVSGTFMELLVVRYSAQLGQKEVQKAMRQYAAKHYNTRKLTKELRRIYNEILASDDPNEIKKLRRQYLQIREQVAAIRDAREKDSTYQGMRIRSRALREQVLKLDEAIMAELRKLGYEIRPEVDPERVGDKIRKLIPEPRTEPVKSDKVEVAAAKPARGE